MTVSELNKTEYSSFISTYIEAAKKYNYTLLESLEISLHDFIKFVQNIPIDKFDYRYEVGKWTIKEIIQHIIDTERVFSYRALCIARNDKTPLPNFNQDDYVANSHANKRSIQELLTELSSVRHATILLFKSFSAQEIIRTGTASNNLISVRAIGFAILGHQKQHQNIFEVRYL